jgi:hypothetical protein
MERKNWRGRYRQKKKTGRTGCLGGEYERVLASVPPQPQPSPYANSGERGGGGHRTRLGARPTFQFAKHITVPWVRLEGREIFCEWRDLALFSKLAQGTLEDRKARTSLSTSPLVNISIPRLMYILMSGSQSFQLHSSRIYISFSDERLDVIPVLVWSEGVPQVQVGPFVRGSDFYPTMTWSTMS